MSFTATTALANIATANAALAAGGWGATNFSVPVFSTTAIPAVAAMHHLGTDPAFRAACVAIPGVTVRDYGSMEVGMAHTIAALGGRWGGDAPHLVGQVTPGLYRATEADGGGLWWVIQAFDRTIFSQALATYPALVRQARIPGEITAWVQPIDANDAYRPVNRFTGQPDMVTDGGKTWICTQGDGAGNNVWQPGVFGWTLV